MLAEVERPIPYGPGKVTRLRERDRRRPPALRLVRRQRLRRALLSGARIAVAVRPKPRLRARAGEVPGLVRNRSRELSATSAAHSRHARDALDPASMDFELTEEQRMIRDTRARLRRARDRPQGRRARQERPLAERDPRQDGRARLPGGGDPAGARRRRAWTPSATRSRWRRSAPPARSCGVIMSVNNSLFCDPRLQVRHRRAEEARPRARARAARSSAASGSPSR